MEYEIGHSCLLSKSAGIKMKQPYTHFLFFSLSCLCIGETKNMMQTKTHVVKQNNKKWKIRTEEGGAEEKGNDHQEENINGEMLCCLKHCFFVN